MCIIATFDREFIQANLRAVLNYIADSAISQGDGLTLISESAVIRTLTTPASIRMIRDLVTHGTDERIWLHFRYGTGGSEVVANTHGWQTTDGWFTLHNGILDNARTTSYPVDSMEIWDTLAILGLEAATNYCQANSYANVFLVHPESGQWVMSRSSVGTLYTDGHGNYASHRIGTATLPVDTGSVECFDRPRKVAPATDWAERAWLATDNDVNVYDLATDLELCRNAIDLDEVCEGYSVFTGKEPILMESMLYLTTEARVISLLSRKFPSIWGNVAKVS